MQFATRNSILNLIQTRNWINKNIKSAIFAFPATDATKIHKDVHRVNRELKGSNILLHFTEQPESYFADLQKIVFINRQIDEIIEPLWYSIPSGEHQQFKKDRENSVSIEEFGNKITPKLEAFKASILAKNTQIIFVEFFDFVSDEDQVLINICDFLFQ